MKKAIESCRTITVSVLTSDQIWHTLTLLEAKSMQEEKSLSFENSRKNLVRKTSLVFDENGELVF